MNASLLGLSRRETDRLFPQIERFAEIGDFIYQPVKTYSSGMYVRVAFAIAASVEPDILISTRPSRWAMPFFSIVVSAA